LLLLQFILKLVQTGGDDSSVLHLQQSASITLKNVLKKRWNPDEDDEMAPLSGEEKAGVKEGIIPLILQSPTKIQKILVEGVSEMASHDFPYEWETLLEDLVGAMNMDDFLWFDSF